MTTEDVAVFAGAAVLAALAGLASLLRSDAEITSKRVVSSLLNSGILGLGISLLWYAKFQDNVYFLIGLCVVAGLGGMTTVDMVISAARRGILSGKLDTGEQEEKS